MGLLRENDRIVSSVPVENASTVSIGSRKSGISIFASTVWLPRLSDRLRTEYKRVLSRTISISGISAAGHRG